MLTALLVSTLFASNVYASSFESYDLNCETPEKIPANAFQAHLTLSAEAWPMDENDPQNGQVRLRGVTFTARFLDSDKETEVGRTKTIDAGRNPRARKYKEYYQVSMDSLTDVKDFDRYMPLDQCTFTVMLPTSMWNNSKFEAPVVTHCDQNGGTQRMECTLGMHQKKKN